MVTSSSPYLSASFLPIPFILHQRLLRIGQIDHNLDQGFLVQDMEMRNSFFFGLFCPPFPQGLKEFGVVDIGFRVGGRAVFVTLSGSFFGDGFNFSR